MRTSWIVIAASVLGCMIGLGFMWYELGGLENRFDLSYVEESSDNARQEEPVEARIVVVGESTFDFGTLEHDQKGSCSFKIRNKGDATLVIERGNVSCGSCLRTDLSHHGVSPGEEFAFNVQFITQTEGPEFSEYVEMRTNDPDKAVVRFNLTGYVTHAIGISKKEISLGSVSAGETVEADFRIYGYEDKPIDIVGHEFTVAASAADFDLKLTALEFDKFKDQEPHATSAVRARVSMKGGNRLGPIKQVLRITAQLKDRSTSLELTILANVVSDISLIGGSAFEQEKSLLRLRSISSTIGHSTSLLIRVRGPLRDEIAISVGEIDPAEALTATIGEPKIVGNGYLYPLKITIPKGAPSVNRLGSRQNKFGVINIETTHPSIKSLPVYVDFAVE